MEGGFEATWSRNKGGGTKKWLVMENNVTSYMGSLVVKRFKFVKIFFNSQFIEYILAELRLIRQEIGFLREENQKQNTEIIILKETVQLQNETITKHEITMKELDHKMKNSENCNKQNYSRKKQKRIRRPARLLPLQLLFDRSDDDEERTTKKPPPLRFYGPPTNCSDLARLGYTLNGYYLVKHNNTNTTTDKSYFSSNSTATDTVCCAFKQDGTFNPLQLEQRVPSLDKLVIEELAHTTEKKVHKDILELKQEMAKLQHVAKHSRSSESYIGSFHK